MAQVESTVVSICDGPAGAGVRTALTKKFEEMYALRDAAVKWRNPKGVHSMRIASRRLRSAISDFMPYVNKRSLTKVLKRIKRLADVLGEVRDHDVAIRALERLRAESPAEVAGTLAVLIKARKEVRRRARLELKLMLDQEHLTRLASEFEAALASATSETKRKRSKSELSYAQVVRAIIRDRLSDLEQLSDSLYRPLDSEPLHDMRIAAKRLRYAIELFEECLDEAALPFAKYAMRLQGSLGKVHDCDVWIESFGKEIVNAKTSGQRDLSDTFVWLFDYFNELRNKHFRQAFTRWNDWEKDSLSDKLKTALG